MNRTQILRAALAAALIVDLSGCAALPRISRWVSIRPVKPADAQAVARGDGYYLSATAAISRRDYAEALELLQAARARKADDIRVLNAFGVVYDKLGRFDLSARYYDLARAVDPASTIVAGNVAYSGVMQARAALPILAEAAPAAAVEPVRFVQAQSTVVRLGFAPQAATLQLAPRGTRGSLEIADASGRADGAEPVRQRLARLGWSAPPTAVRTAPMVARSVITYPASRGVDARGLARTLPVGVRLVDCAQACSRLRLVLGADSTRWALAARGD